MTDTTNGRTFFAVDYWDGGERSYRRLHRDDRDESISLEQVVSDMMAELGVDDGELVTIQVHRRTGLTSRFGELRMRAVGRDLFEREREEEVGIPELLLRRASRRLGRPTTRPLVADTSISRPGEVPDGWVLRIAELWEEDEVLLRDPDAEHLAGAVQRICGCSREELGPKLASVDNGDGGYDLYRDGWVVGWSYCGHSIHRLVVEKSP